MNTSSLRGLISDVSKADPQSWLSFFQRFDIRPDDVNLENELRMAYRKYGREFSAELNDLLVKNSRRIAAITGEEVRNVVDSVYRQLRTYNDTLRDSTFTVFLCDSVFGNQIIARSWHGESYQRTTVIIKEPPTLKKWRYGIGAGGLYSQGMCAPAVLVSAQRQRFMFFGLVGTSAIGAGVNIRLYNER